MYQSQYIYEKECLIIFNNNYHHSVLYKYYQQKHLFFLWFVLPSISSVFFEGIIEKQLQKQRTESTLGVIYKLFFNLVGVGVI